MDDSINHNSNQNNNHNLWVPDVLFLGPAGAKGYLELGLLKIFEEENYIQTRLQKDNNRQAVTTGNMAAALFQHDTSRELDPQLHTHSFLLNFTQRKDGKFRALHNEKLFENKSE